MTQSLSVVENQNTIQMYQTSKEVYQHVQLIQQVMKNVMIEKEHYGTIPGCGTKKVLMKSGAEVLCLTFRLAPRFSIIIKDLENGHKIFEVICELFHIETGKFLGQGVGMGSTMESKYRWRNSAKACTQCGVEAIMRGKEEWGGGWYCNKNKGGCGAKFPNGDKAIENQIAGKIENQDIADQYNTVLKMAKKRALVDCVLTVTAASDIFTQDLDEDIQQEEKKPAADVKKPVDVIAKVDTAPNPEMQSYNILLQELHGFIKSIETADDANSFVDYIRQLKHVHDSKDRARKLFRDHCIGIGLIADKHSGKWVKKNNKKRLCVIMDSTTGGVESYSYWMKLYKEKYNNSDEREEKIMQRLKSGWWIETDHGFHFEEDEDLELHQCNDSII